MTEQTRSLIVACLCTRAAYDSVCAAVASYSSYLVFDIRMSEGYKMVCAVFNAKLPFIFTTITTGRVNTRFKEECIQFQGLLTHQWR